MYVLDSSTLIELINDRSRAAKIEEYVTQIPLATTSVCVHEILAGALSVQDHFLLERFLSGLRILNHDLDAARIGSSIEQELRRVGKLINGMDILIAAICKAHHATLITLDNDFSRIKGLDVIVLH